MFSGRILEKDICNISDYQHKEEKNHKDYTSCLSSYNILVVQYLSFFCKGTKRVEHAQIFFRHFFLAQKYRGDCEYSCTLHKNCQNQVPIFCQTPVQQKIGQIRPKIWDIFKKSKIIIFLAFPLLCIDFWGPTHVAVGNPFKILSGDWEFITLKSSKFS